MSKRKRRFLGRPMSYWERQARELVVYTILTGVWRYENSGNIVHEMAAKRLWELACAEDPTAVDRLQEERTRCMAGFARAINDVSARLAAILDPSGEQSSQR